MHEKLLEIKVPPSYLTDGDVIFNDVLAVIHLTPWTVLHGHHSVSGHLPVHTGHLHRHTLVDRTAEKLTQI